VPQPNYRGMEPTRDDELRDWVNEGGYLDHMKVLEPVETTRAGFAAFSTGSGPYLDRATAVAQPSSFAGRTQ
jgi:hypothetical protein